MIFDIMAWIGSVIYAALMIYLLTISWKPKRNPTPEISMSAWIKKDNEWFHLCIIIQGFSSRIYLNGKEITFDDLMIWDIALMDNEAKKLYKSYMRGQELKRKKK